MFYSQNILSRRHGKFGIIWIAATKAVNLSKREYYTVDLTQSCEDIIRMLTLRAEPFTAGGPRPRLSLYLSSQLMYGCVKVYNRQNDFLLADLKDLQMKFSSGTVMVPIDLVPLSDRVTHAHFGEEDPMSPIEDLNFGKLRTVPVDMSLDTMPEVEVWQPLPVASPERLQADIVLPHSPLQPHRVSPPPKRRRHKPGLNESLQARIGDITLTEEPIQKTPWGPELVPGQIDIPPMTTEALEEFSAIPADVTAPRKDVEPESTDEPKAKRPRRMSVAAQPVYAGEVEDTEERQRQLTEMQHQFEERLDAQQRIIDDILERNDGDSQNLETEDAQNLQTERAKLQRMEREFEESLRELELDAEMRDIEAGVAPPQDATIGAGLDFFQPEMTELREDEVQLVPPITDATMQDDGRLPPAEETPAVMVGIPLDQIDLVPHARERTPGVTPGALTRDDRDAAAEERRRRREQFRMDLSPIAMIGPQATARHRRQLKFADAEIKMKRDLIHNNMRKGQDTCVSNDIPMVNFRNATNLFDNPTRNVTKKLRRLWKRNAFTRSVATGNESRSCWGVPDLVPSSDSDPERTPLAKQLDDLTLSPVRPVNEEQLIAEQEQAAQLELEQLEQQMHEIPDPVAPDASVARDVSSAEAGRDATREMSVPQESIEAVREASRVSVDEPTAEGSFMPGTLSKETPDTADRPKSRRTRKSSPEDIAAKPTTTPEITELTLIQEEREFQASPVLPPADPVRPAHTAPAPVQLPDDLEGAEIRAKLERMIGSETDMEDVTTFKAVCPTSSNRKTAALMFCAILGLCKQQKVEVRQDEPYADIYICRGEKFEE